MIPIASHPLRERGIPGSPVLARSGPTETAVTVPAPSRFLDLEPLFEGGKLVGQDDPLDVALVDRLSVRGDLDLRLGVRNVGDADSEFMNEFSVFRFSVFQFSNGFASSISESRN